MLDSCAFGPLHCTGNYNRAESVVEPAHFDPSSTRHSTGTVISDPTDRLRRRLQTYQSKGWISQQEHNKYTTTLKAIRVDDDGEYPSASRRRSLQFNPILQEMEYELNLLEERVQGMKKRNGVSPSRVSCLPTPAAMMFARTKNVHNPQKPNQSNGNNAGHIIGNSDSTYQRTFVAPSMSPSSARYKKKATRPNPQLTTNNRAFRKARPIDPKNPPLICQPEQLQSILTEKQLSELFLETCFFARLGFVQPPCCLQCTYHESQDKIAPNLQCDRWVVWRKDAAVLLSPEELDGNVIIVQCRAARKLLTGQSIDGHAWDSKARKIFTLTDEERKIQAETNNNRLAAV